MANTSKKRRFIKLGEHAFGFADPWSKFHVSKGQVKELETPEQRRSNKIKNALRGGHLENASEEEFLAYQSRLSGKPLETEPEEEKGPTLREQLEELTKEKLVDYYQDHYEVDEDDLKSFKRLKHEDMVEELLELAEEE